MLASRPFTALATRLLGYGIPVFMLHRMDTDDYPNQGGISPQHLRRCLQYLADHEYSFTSLEKLVRSLINGQPLPRKTVAFTMDDGYADQAEVAAPIFLEYGCPITFFVITGMLDQTLWPWDAKTAWIAEAAGKVRIETSISGTPHILDFTSSESRRQARRMVQGLLRETPAENIPEMIRQFARDAGVTVPEQAPARFQPMTWDMARRLESKGVQFAPHSVTHNILSRLTPESLSTEIRDSWKTLQTELDDPVKIFCYPTGRPGDYGSREIMALESNGYLGAVSATPAFVETCNREKYRAYNLPRLALPGTMGDFVQYCSWIEYAKTRQRNYQGLGASTVDQP